MIDATDDTSVIDRVAGSPYLRAEPADELVHLRSKVTGRMVAARQAWTASP